MIISDYHTAFFLQCCGGNGSCCSLSLTPFVTWLFTVLLYVSCSFQDHSWPQSLNPKTLSKPHFLMHVTLVAIAFFLELTLWSWNLCFNKARTCCSPISGATSSVSWFFPLKCCKILRPFILSRILASSSPCLGVLLLLKHTMHLRCNLLISHILSFIQILTITMY